MIHQSQTKTRKVMKTKTVSTKIKDFKSGEQPSAAPAHTPGPWKVAMNGKQIWAENNTVTIFHVQPVAPSEDQANARLISLAPEMLEVLGACKPIIIETVEKWSNGEDSYQDILDKINSLLSRASQ